MRLAAVMPVFNEADVLWHTIAHLVENGVHVYVLDNESSDGSPDIALSFPREAVTVATFSTGGEFHALRHQQAIRTAMSRIEADWIIRADADEFVESPWSGVSLAEGIKLAAAAGYDAIGVASHQFYPMSDEPRHRAGEDVRECYDHFILWDGVDRWDPGLHTQARTMWKINILRNRDGLSFRDSHVPALPRGSSMMLCPTLFELRHYPYRAPERTRHRLLAERRDRMAAYNVEHDTDSHYAKYGDDSSFVRCGFVFDHLRGQCTRWSERVKSPVPASPRVLGRGVGG